jgi:hypothetical protein
LELFYILIKITLKQEILKAIKNTSNTHQKKKYFLEIPKLINLLASTIGNNTYKPSKFSCFVVKDPKTREIFAPDYIDRIVHHLIIDRIEPFVDKKFIFHSYANRKNKGTHQAIKRLQKFLRKEGNQYYLKGDIKTFFPSVDKNILWYLVSNQVKQIKESVLAAIGDHDVF